MEVYTLATPREQLADALKQARIDAGYPYQRLLAKRLAVSRPVISRAENPAEVVPAPGLITRWADVTGADVDALNDLAKRARNPRSLFIRWADDYEQRATLIREFAPLLIPGLFQTEDYARALVSWKPFSASDVEDTLRERLARQSVLDRAELRVLLLGSVLRREVGNAQVMSEQIDHLLNLGARASVTLQIVPDTPDVAGALSGVFAIATQGTHDIAVLADSLVQSTVHIETDLIERACLVFDGLRADALPWQMTREFLTEVGNTWKQQTTG
jgi:transcriptional regulator with XRE-family HTH domain